ncbi:hypothetical protein COV93_08685 [Candidatus Woesearchaeota archaeon CG11_big_fil_rev_8_21_14_0_20_43_8]|nr:MAG: hypothetical protein COV93_08685 [Candidatus Woesearchaeota archaeon CG11_big_fil_rev_8_21_14_0_20_43_8]PIO08915.1 MAG: hypothetical protein COT47_00670 [Candidatus Woesearchaeota archaeon CG08_land_8_20_14_0_20_43_7]
MKSNYDALRSIAARTKRSGYRPMKSHVEDLAESQKSLERWLRWKKIPVSFLYTPYRLPEIFDRYRIGIIGFQKILSSNIFVAESILEQMAATINHSAKKMRLDSEVRERTDSEQRVIYQTTDVFDGLDGPESLDGHRKKQLRSQENEMRLALLGASIDDHFNLREIIESGYLEVNRKLAGFRMARSRTDALNYIIMTGQGLVATNNPHSELFKQLIPRAAEDLAIIRESIK